jgi:hypothetical protein
MNDIDTMIDILSENPPEFLDITIKSHNIAFEYTSHLLLLSKVLCVQYTHNLKGIDSFTNNYYEVINQMINKVLDDDISNLCYEYLNEYYTNMIVYLEKLEEYEMCHNFMNFIKTFNEKIDRLNEL